MSGVRCFTWVIAIVFAMTSSTDGTAAVGGTSCSLVVTTTADDGAGSLRQAIQCANSNPGRDIITFAIPGTGPHVIQLQSELPFITDPVTVDGFSQAGSHPNTRVGLATDAALQIELRGTPGIQDGFRLLAAGCLVQGLAINSFGFSGIRAPGGCERPEGKLHRPGCIRIGGPSKPAHRHSDRRLHQ